MEPTLDQKGNLEHENEKNLTLEELNDNKEESQELNFSDNALVKIDTFTLPMDFVPLGIEEDLKSSHLLISPQVMQGSMLKKGISTLLLV